MGADTGIKGEDDDLAKPAFDRNFFGDFQEMIDNTQISDILKRCLLGNAFHVDRANREIVFFQYDPRNVLMEPHSVDAAMFLFIKKMENSVKTDNDVTLKPRRKDVTVKFVSEIHYIGKRTLMKLYLQHYPIMGLESGNLESYLVQSDSTTSKRLTQEEIARMDKLLRSNEEES